MKIYRSVDSLRFDVIGEIEGVCGSSSDPVRYNFTDEEPKENRTNYYKIELGGQTQSNIVSVHFIRLADAGYLLAPNPVKKESRLFYFNDKSELHHLHIYSLSGKEINGYQSKKNYFDLDFGTAENGIYIFQIVDSRFKIITEGYIVVQN